MTAVGGENVERTWIGRECEADMDWEGGCENVERTWIGRAEARMWSGRGLGGKRLLLINNNPPYHYINTKTRTDYVSNA